MHQILVVDDENDIVELVSLNLQREGYTLLTAHDGIEAVSKARELQPDLVVLDLMLPGKNGFAVFKDLRGDARTSQIPVIMLTAKGELEDKITGLELGADDYVTKPFSPKELMLRIKSLIKRTRRVKADASLKSGSFLLDRNSLKLFLGGNQIDLTSTEFKLLRLLVEANGTPLPREDLLREVWGYDENVMTRTLDTHIKRLREKLADFDRCIVTIRGVGYSFHPDK